MLCRSIIFTKVPLVKALRYKEIFQLVPFFYFAKMPFSKYAMHFPAVLEYDVDNFTEEIQPYEDELRRRGLSEDVISLGRKLPSQVRVRKEILHLLTALTNFHFFEYGSGGNCWGIQTPMIDVDKLSEDELKKLNTQTSHWTIRSFVYPDVAKDLQIVDFTTCQSFCEVAENSYSYFTVNPHTEANNEIKIPPTFESVLDNYYALDEDDRFTVRQCIGLMFEGVELFESKRSVSLLSTISSIEGMARLDLLKYGESKNLSACDSFLRYLKTFVAGRSEEKFRRYYAKRCEITHEGVLFLNDLDLYEQTNEEDWRFRLEVQQVARLALYNWLNVRRKNRNTVGMRSTAYT